MMTDIEALKLAIDAAAEERERLNSTALFGDWLPIETAPKDGSEILLLEHETIHHAHWGGSFHNAFTTKGRIGFVDRATHWMPVPNLKPNDQEMRADQKP